MQNLKRWAKNLSLPKRMMYIFITLILVKIGMVMPIPFIDKTYLQDTLSKIDLGAFSMLTGNAFSQMSFLTLGISPYISASIIIQLLAIVIPSLEEMMKDGESGKQKYKKITIMVSIALVIIQATAMAIGFGKSGLLSPFSVKTVICTAVCWSLGAILLIIISLFLDLFNLGSGVSMLLFLNIVSSVPQDMIAAFEMFIKGKSIAKQIVSGTLIAAFLFSMFYACVLMLNTEKRIKISTSRKMSSFGSDNQSTFPIPFLACSVMPVIFTSSLMSVPLLLSSFIPKLQTGAFGKIAMCFNQNNWFKFDDILYSIGVIPYVLLCSFFTFFYLEIGFNPREIANNLKKSGTNIMGIRPGKPTEDYIRKVSRETSFIGNACLMAMILVTSLILNNLGISRIALSGTSSIIAVSVVKEVSGKISSELLSQKAVERIRSKSLSLFAVAK